MAYTEASPSQAYPTTAAPVAVQHSTHTLTVAPGRTLTSEVWELTDQPAHHTLFLLSGVGHWSHLWEGTGVALAQAGARAIALNYRGHGEGELLSLWDHPVSQATFANYADDTARVIADAADRYHLAHGQYSVVGHSMGGGVAILYASREPVQHLLLVGSCAMSMWLGVYGSIVVPITRAVGMSAITEATFQGADAFFIDRTHPASTRRIRHTLFDDETDPEDVAAVLDHLNRESKQLMPAFFAHWLPWQRRADRAALKRNVRQIGIIGFERDVFFPPTAIKKTVKEYGIGDHYTIIPGAPHDGFADRRYAPAFFAALRGLLLGEVVDRLAQDLPAIPADDLADDSASDLAQALPGGTGAGRGEEE